MMDASALLWTAVFTLSMIAVSGWYLVYGADYFETQRRLKKKAQSETDKCLPGKISHRNANQATQSRAANDRESHADIGVDTLLIAHIINSNHESTKPNTSSPKPQQTL